MSGHRALQQIPGHSGYAYIIKSLVIPGLSWRVPKGAREGWWMGGRRRSKEVRAVTRSSAE